MEFDWDPVKEKLNIKKHGVSFGEASETFSDPNGIRLKDEIHSIHEIRFYWVGKTSKERILTTWFTERDNKIRIIGSGEWRRFRRYYETAQIK